MSLHLEVKKLSQDVSIGAEGPVTQNYVLFELPNGSIVKAQVNDQAAEALMDAMINGASSQRTVQQDNGYEPPSPPPGFQPTVSEKGESVLEFGGTPPKPAARPRTRLVGKDEYGYPIVQRLDADPGESPGGDEDGVGQV